MMKGRENTMLNQKQIDFVKHAKKLFPNKVELTLADLVQANKEFGHKYEPQWLTKNKLYRVDRGLFKLPNIDDKVSEETKVSKTETVKDNKVSEAAYIVSSLTGDIVPKKDSVFVSFGNYPDVKSIVKSRMFYPVFITGLSGNGKTMGVTQACAENRREMIRVNITIETDEDDLLGGYR